MTTTIQATTTDGKQATIIIDEHARDTITLDGERCYLPYRMIHLAADDLRRVKDAVLSAWAAATAGQPAATATTCRLWTRDQGCPLHGETCSPERGKLR